MSPEERTKHDENEWFRVSRTSVDEMDEHLIENINKVVGKSDTLWHIGDFAWPKGGRNECERIARNYRRRINCSDVRLIWGNHDRRSFSPAFTKTYDKYMLKVDGQRILMDHTAHAVWVHSHHGAWHLYGHSHTTAEKWLDKHMPERRSIDVGVDNAARIVGAYRPFSFDELHDIFKYRRGCSIDHHEESEEGR